MTHRHSTAVLLLALLLSPAAGARAQESIASDRPGIGSGAYVLDRGTLQVEAGAEYASVGTVDQYSLGQLLIRVGIPAIELRAALNSYVSLSGAGIDGLQDIGLGLKGRLLRSADGRLAVSGLAAVSLPTGSDLLTSDEVIPSATLLADWAVSGQWTLSGNVGYSLGTGLAEDVVALIVTPAVAFPGSKLSAYFGYAGLYSSPGDSHFIEGGFALAATRDLQLDLNGGVNADGGDYFVGLGFSTRWRKR